MTVYTFHPIFERARIQDYVTLFELAFPNNRKLNQDYLTWLYINNPDGHAVGFDAYMGTELAAHYVTIPRRYILGNVSYNALLSVNTATHPSHQRRGLFKKLAESTYELGQSQGFDFVVGAANSNSTHGFVKSLGFTELGRIRMLAWNPKSHLIIDRLRLDLRQNWLKWRLDRPGMRYRLTRTSDGMVRIQTRSSGIGVTLGIVPSSIIPANLACSTIHALPLIPNLTPIFPVPESAIRIPDMIHPSPWNVIFRPLSSSGYKIDTSLVCFDGLGMDTF